MMTPSLLQLYSGPSGTPGEHGFRLTGRAKNGEGLCRVQLRYMEPWHRYPDPRLRSTTWDLRVYTRAGTAFILDTELTAEGLEALGEDYEFPDGADALATLKANGDLVHDRVLAWARQVTGAPELPPVTDINPAVLAVRYKKSEAGAVQIPRIPAGRPLPPGQSPLILNADSTPLTDSGIQAGDRSAPATKPAASKPQALSPSGLRPPALRPPGKPATKPAADASAAPKPAGKLPLPSKGGAASSKQSLTERLSAIREQSAKTEKSPTAAEDEKA